MAGEVLNKYADVDIKHIPFKGSAQSLNSLLGGHVDLLFGGLSSLKTALDGKQIKVLAVTNAEPSPELVDAPTVAQALPGIEFPKAYMFTSWLGISAPAGTPDKIVEKLGNLMQQALENPQFRQKLINVGVTPGYVARQEMVEHIRNEVPAYIRVVKDIGITN
jgi:tripartite-type tricarboxylate transporter receptor subunit TctC